MICPNCKKEKEPKDFLKKEICYKCEYKRKKKEIKDKKICKICGTSLPDGRWKYCSDTCAKKGKRSKRHWTCKVKGDHWKDYIFKIWNN